METFKFIAATISLACGLITLVYSICKIKKKIILIITSFLIIFSAFLIIIFLYIKKPAGYGISMSNGLYPIM